MGKYLRIKIQDSIYYLDDGPISIYRKSSDYCIVKQKSNLTKNYQISVIDKIDEEGNVPIRLDKKEDHLKIYINKNRSFDIYCYTGSENLHSGINILEIPDEKSSIVIGNESEKEYIYLNSIEYENKKSKKQEYKNELLGPYENKNMGSHLNRDINDLDRIVNILQKSKSARYLGEGGSRIVFKIKDKSDFNFLNHSDGSIIKVARNDHNISTNRRENQAWQAVKGTQIGRYFCPITNHGPEHKYTVMRKAKFVEDESEEYQEIANRISKDIKECVQKPSEFEYDPVKYDLLESMISYNYDITADNIGKYKNKYVLVDYPFGGLIKIDKR
jgi:hypothetical protein